jgi:hypothetical protein
MRAPNAASRPARRIVNPRDWSDGKLSGSVDVVSMFCDAFVIALTA